MATKIIVFNGFSRNDMRNVKVGRGGLVSSIPKEGDYIQLTGSYSNYRGVSIRSGTMGSVCRRNG